VTGRVVDRLEQSAYPRPLRHQRVLTEIGIGAAVIGNLYQETTDQNAEEAVQSAWRASTPCSCRLHSVMCWRRSSNAQERRCRRRLQLGNSRPAATQTWGQLNYEAAAHPPESTDRRQDGAMEVLASRILLRPTEPRRSHRFYREILGLAIYRQFGSRDAPGVVFFLGNGLLEVSGRSTEPPRNAMAIWIQVRDVQSEHSRLLHAGVPILREPRQEAWGLLEMWIADPDGVRIVLVEVPADHPLRRDQRDLATLDE
jgi:predicted enzyme related to lactoylglutathione lyase